MKFIAMLPWKIVLDDNELDAAAFDTGNKDAGFYCEKWDTFSKCPAGHMVFGTSDTNEPKFCPKHYFEINDGDGVSNYKLVANGR